jgi:hypothetical protein
MDNFSDLQKDIDSAIYSAYQFGNVTGAPQNTTFNGDVAAQMLKENIKTTPSLVSTSGGVPSVYGDSQMNLTFERYYMHPNFSRLGYSPWRDNDRLYNENSSWMSNLGRSAKAMGHIAMESFASNKPFISTLDLFDPLNYDEESAGSISRMMKLGYDTSGGFGAFTNNFLLNTGITLGIAGSAIIEEAVIAATAGLLSSSGIGLAPGAGLLATGTALNVGKFVRNINKVFNANETIFKLARNADEVKSIYDFSKIGKALDGPVANFFNPLSNTATLLKNYPETFKGLNALGKTATSFGAFYADVRAAARVLNEAQMEGGLVINQMVEDGIRKEYDATGQYPTEEKIAGIRAAAENAAFATTMINLPLIFFSNKVGLDNIIKQLPKGTGLLSALDEVNQFGSISKIKGQGYKYLSTPLQKVSAGLRPTEIGKSFLNYTRYNFAEAIQENLQEATSAGVINYYTKLFENPMIDQHMLLKESVALGLGEQFTAQGLETFFSGFLTGGLMGGMGKLANLGLTAGQRIYDPEKFKAYQEEKEKLKLGFEESANFLDKNFLDLGRGYADILNPNAVNAAQQSAANKTMNAASQTGNVKLSKDAQRLSIFEHVSNAIKGGFYNNLVDDYRSQLELDDKSLAEAFGKDITEVPQLRSDIAKAISGAESIKKLHDKYNFVNPVSLKGVDKKDPMYAKLLAKKNAIETVRKMLIMAEDTIMDGTARKSKMLESMMTMLPEFGEIDSDDVLVLVDSFRLNGYKIDQLIQEIELAKSTQSSPTTTPEDREKAKVKENYLKQKIAALQELAKKFDSFRTKIKSNTEFTDEERQNLLNDYKLYIDLLNKNPERKSSVVKTENINESLNYILDYISLESENELLTSIISVLQDPQGFATTVNDTTDYLEKILNDASFVANMVNRGVSLLEHNALYNFMFSTYGVFINEYEDGSVDFIKPSADVTDSVIPVDRLSDEYDELLNAFYDKKVALSKVDKETEKLKEKKKKAAEQLSKDKKDFERIKDKIRKSNSGLSDEAVEALAKSIFNSPLRFSFVSAIDKFDKLAQNIENAASTPTTKEEIEEALELLNNAKFKIVKDPDTKRSYYVQVDEEGNPIDGTLEWIRVTSLYRTKEFATEKFSHRGNIIDGLLRTLIGDKTISKEKFKEAYSQLQKENPEAFEFTDANLDTLRSVLENFISNIEAQGYTLRADIPTLWGKIDGQFVAGTPDILAINDKGEALLIDLKTSSSDRRKAYAMEAALKKIAGDKYDLVKEKIIENQNKIVSKDKNLRDDPEVGEIITNFLSIEENGIKPYFDVKSIFFYRDSDENQLNSYADLLEQRTGIKVTGLFILPLTIQDSNKTKAYTKIEASVDSSSGTKRLALKVGRKQPPIPKAEEEIKSEEGLAEEEKKKEEVSEEEVKKPVDASLLSLEERIELINNTIGILEKRKERGEQSITNVENTLEYLNELLDETSELGFEEVKKILNTIKTLEEAISSNSARKSKRGQNITLSIEEYKKQFRTEKQLFNDIANRIKYLKEDLEQLKKIDKDLSDQINYYRNMIANKNFETLSFEEIEEKIETINKKKSVLEKIIASLVKAIKQSVFYLKEYVRITTKAINDLEIFKKNTNFKRLNTEELRKLIDAEDSSATTEYDKLRKQADELEKAIENNLDSIEIVEGAKQKEKERLDDLYNVVQKYNNQIRYLNNLLAVLYPDLYKIKLEKAAPSKPTREQRAPETKKAPTPTAKPSAQKTEARLEDAKKEKEETQKRTAKPKKEKPAPVSDIEAKRKKFGLQNVKGLFEPAQGAAYFRVILKGDNFDILAFFEKGQWSIFPKQSNGEFQASDPKTGNALVLSPEKRKEVVEKYAPKELIDLLEAADKVKGLDQQDKFMEGDIKNYLDLYKKENLEYKLDQAKQSLQIYESPNYPNKDAQERIVKDQKETIAKLERELAALKETPTGTNVDAKIDDIEKTRQEELKENQRQYDVSKRTNLKGIETFKQKLIDNPNGLEALDGTYQFNIDDRQKSLDKLEKELPINIDRINAISDAKYVDAVNKGEMTKEQAMQALEKVGRKDSDAYKQLAALKEPVATETATQTNTSSIGNVSSIKLDTTYPIYKDNKQVGSVTVTSVNGIPVFVFNNTKGSVSKPSEITTLSNNFFNANPGLFEYWYNTLLNEDNRQAVSLYKTATSPEQKEMFVARFGISKSVFDKNKNLLDNIIKPTEDFLEFFVGKLIYGTPGIGKTRLVQEYNSRPESERKYTLIDVDDLLLNRLAEINKTKNFAGDLEFTNENIFAIINAFNKKVGYENLDSLVYNPVLNQINQGKNEKNTNKIYVTGSKRFIKDADIAVLSEQRSDILRNRILTGETDVAKYIAAENEFDKKVIVLTEGQTFSDVLLKGADVVEAEAAFYRLKMNLFNRIIFDESLLTNLITELSGVNVSSLNSNEIIELFSKILTKESPFYSEFSSLRDNLDTKATELFNYFESFYNSERTTVSDKNQFLRKVINTLANVSLGTVSITDLNNPLTNFIVLEKIVGDNLNYFVFSAIGAEPQLKSQSISSFVDSVSKNKNKILSFKQESAGEGEKIDTPSGSGKDMDNLPEVDAKAIFNKPCTPNNPKS